jgi:hypothetical protein
MACKLYLDDLGPSLQSRGFDRTPLIHFGVTSGPRTGPAPVRAPDTPVKLQYTLYICELVGRVHL